MKILKKYKAYKIKEDGYDIFLFALGQYFTAIKFGKDDYVSTRGSYDAITFLLKKDIALADFSDSGFDGIGRYIIQNYFEGSIEI